MTPEASRQPIPSALELRLFGPFTASRNGQPLAPFRTRKGHSLLALLALRAGRAVERQWLAGVLWPESSEEHARYNLRRCLSDLRRVLGPDTVRLSSNRRDQTITLNLQGATVDVVDFDEAVQRSDFGSLKQAAELWRGPLLEGSLEEWLLPERQVRERALIDALEALARHAAAREDWGSAEHHLRRVVGVDPLRESAHRALMQTLDRAGNPAAALQCFRDLRRLLARELNVAPAPETVAIVREVRAAYRQELRTALPPTTPTTSATSGNVPRPLTDLIGREQALVELERCLDQGRLLTLTGAGGVGKTRLAIGLVDAVAGEFHDGVWFVDLAPLSDGSHVARATATVLGIREQANRILVDQLIESLDRKQLLLVLDNCEHLVQACSALAETLLRRCRRLHICATSRQPLGVQGEIVWRVSPLAVPDLPPAAARGPDLVSRVLESAAAQLFAARATQCRHDFHVSVDNAHAVAAICVRLDGIPLAIELAAARTSVLSPEQIAERLFHRFRLLTGGTNATPRHHTLQAALDWSHDLLDARERVLLWRLSSFSGGATLPAVEDVCSGGLVEAADVLELVTALVDKSLVAITIGTSENRCQLLETIREYAGSHLERSGEAQAAKSRHAAFFLQLAIDAESQLPGPDQAMWLSRLNVEHHNLRAALGYFDAHEPALLIRLAVALHTFWEVRGHYVEGRAWLERALERSEPVLTIWRARAGGAAGRLAWFQEDYRAASGLLEESLTRFETLGERRSVVTVLGSLSRAAAAEGDFPRARALGERAVAEARALSDKRLLASQLRDCALVGGVLGDFATASALDVEALTLCRELGDQRGIAQALMGLGLSGAYTGDPLSARPLLLETLALARELGDSWLMSGALLGLGHVERLLGNMEAAHGQYAQSLRVCRESDGNWNGHLFEAIAALAAAEGCPMIAAQLLGACEAIREDRRLSLLPLLREAHDRTVATARAALADGAFAAAWEEGRAMRLERATAVALERDRWRTSPSPAPEM